MSTSASAALPKTSFVVPSRDFAIAYILFLALTANFLFASGHDSQRCVEVAALCIAAVVMLVRVGMGEMPTVSTSSGVLLMTFFVLGAVSSLSAYSPRHAVFEWTSFLLLLALLFSLAGELAHDAARLQRLLHWTAIACGLYSLRIVIMYVAALAGGYQPDWYVLATGFSNPRFLNHTQTALLPFIVMLYLKEPKASGWRRAWFALISFWWALIFMTEARATILALSVGCACALSLRRSHARRFIVTITWTAITGLVVYALVFVLLPQWFGLKAIGLPTDVLARTVANPTSDRSYLWTLAQQLIVAHPWLGVGPQHFAHEAATLYKAAHPHDWILQIAAEWGIPAMLCLAGVMFLGGRALLRSGKRLAATDLAAQQMQVTLIVASSAIFVDALVSGVLVMPQSRLAIVLVVGIACAWVRLQGDAPLQRESRQSILSRVLAGGLVAAALGGLIWSVAPDYVRHARDGVPTPAELTANPEQHWPRMWEAGYF